MKIVAIDDSPEIIEALDLCFQMRWPGTSFYPAYDAASGLRLLEQESPDLVILDIGLPDMDGLQVLQEIRRFSNVPIIMLTVRDRDVDIAKALELGADEYITKPFSHVELLARARALLRRVNMEPLGGEPPLTAGELWIDFASREVRVKGVEVKLTPTEYRLLEHLVRNAGRVVTYQTLLAKVWGYDRDEEPDVRVVKVHMQHLRQKLGEASDNPRYITNVYGVGYKFIATPSTALRPPQSNGTPASHNEASRSGER